MTSGFGTDAVRYVANGGTLGTANVSETPVAYPVGLVDVPVNALTIVVTSTYSVGEPIRFDLVWRDVVGGTEVVVFTVEVVSGEGGVVKRSTLPPTVLPGGDQATYDLRVTTNFDDTEVLIRFAGTIT